MATSNTREKDSFKQADLPQTPDRVRAAEMAAHQQRKRKEPAAVPLEADAEAGAQTTPSGSKPRSAADNPSVFVVDGAGDVRAGPGDAGATDRPRVLDDPRDKAPSSRWMILSMLAIALLALIAILAM